MPSNKIITFVCPSASAFLHHHVDVAIAASKEYVVHAILADDDNVRHHLAANPGIIFHSIPMSRNSGNPTRILLEALALRHILRRIKPDIVNAINLKAVLVTAMANVGLSSRLVSTIPGLGYMFAGNTWRQTALRMATMASLRLLWTRQANLAIFSNQDDVREFVERRIVRKEHTRIIPVPGVNLRWHLPSPEPETGFRVVLPARMLWDKGVGEFVAAAAEFQSLIPDAEFLLAGDPDPDNPTSISRETLERWSADDVVRWLGHCDDIPGLLATCHVVCLPTKYREGMPRVLAEAMACARPVVTSTMPGCRELDPRAGILVEPGNVSMLVDALLHLYRNPKERREMGMRGRERAVELYDAESITSRVLECFQEV